LPKTEVSLPKEIRAMPSRKISNRGSKKNIGKFPSIKMGRTIKWESLIERDEIYLLEYDREVTAYEEQPDRIHYVLDGKKHYYTPDFKADRAGKVQIVEVKLKKAVDEGKYTILFREIKWLLCQNGREFVVATDKMIRVEPKLSNIKLLYRYARVPVLVCHQGLCQRFFRARREASIRELYEFFSSEEVENGLQVIYSLLYWGYLEIDLMKMIELESMVWLPGTEPKGGE
jgi:TnsA endonuclease-like protein